MKQTRLLLLTAAICGVLYMPVACSNNDGPGGDGDGDGDGDAATGGEAGGTGDGDGDGDGTGGGDGDGDGTGGAIVVDCDGEGTACTDGSNCCSGYCDPVNNSCSCASAGELCESGGDCCSGQCNSLTKTCALILGQCLQAESPCETSAECCTLSCVDELCSDTQCVADSEGCDQDGECCSGQCVDGSCADVNGGASCKSAGNPCPGGNGDCCSGLCTDGFCALGSSYCVQRNDICVSDSQCCQGNCIMGTGATVGYCGENDASGSNCDNKLASGEVCGGEDACGECCSRTCAPYGPSGLFICQPTRGCRPDGEMCRTALDCCGGDPDSSIPGAGQAECRKENPSDDVGRCKVTGCNPHGAICGSPDNGTTACVDENGNDEDNTAPNGQSCCEKQGVDQPCSVDSLRVPRCDVLNGCVDAGGECATADDCCSGLPCVQDETGTFICYDPPGGSCVESGGPCTADADCCVGSLCLLEPGQSTGVCGTTTPPPGTGGSGMGGGSGTGGGPSVCAAYGQDCSSTSCCNSVPCDGVTQTCRFGGG